MKGSLPGKKYRLCHPLKHIEILLIPIQPLLNNKEIKLRIPEMSTWAVVCTAMVKLTVRTSTELRRLLSFVRERLRVKIIVLYQGNEVVVFNIPPVPRENSPLPPV